MKNSGKFQNSMRAVTINSEFSLPGLNLIQTITRLVAIPLNRFARLRRQHKAYSITYLMDV